MLAKEMTPVLVIWIPPVPVPAKTNAVPEAALLSAMVEEMTRLLAP